MIICYICNLKAIFILDNHKTKRTHKKENFVIWILKRPPNRSLGSPETRDLQDSNKFTVPSQPRTATSTNPPRDAEHPPVKCPAPPQPPGHLRAQRSRTRPAGLELQTWSVRLRLGAHEVPPPRREQLPPTLVTVSSCVPGPCRQSRG